MTLRRRPGRSLPARLAGYSFHADRWNPLTRSWMPPWGRARKYLLRRQVAWWLDGLRLDVCWHWGPYGPVRPR